MYEPPSASSAIRRASADTAVRIVSWRAALDRDLLQRPVRGVPVLARGVERADLRRVGAEQRGARRPGHERLVQVHDVGPERAQRFERALRPSFWSCAIGEMDPLLTYFTLGPTDVTPGLGRRAVARADDPCVHPEGPQRARASPST